MISESEFLVQKLQKYVGWTIQRVVLGVDEDEEFPIIEIRSPLGVESTLTILRDPEGNGPGWIDAR